jgi:hypothetical protein
MVPQLWKMENYKYFMEVRKTLLAEEMNKRLAEQLHGNALAGRTGRNLSSPSSVIGGISSQKKRGNWKKLNAWWNHRTAGR